MSRDLPPRLTLPASGSAVLRARWVFPVCSPPLENATLEIVDGRITALHQRSTGPGVIDLGNCAIIPGLVNAHTHLELSDVDRPLAPPAPFTAWLQSVIAHRKERAGQAGSDEQAVAAGTAECRRAGTTVVADIVGRIARPAADSERSTCRTIEFLELLGLRPERRAEQLQRARAHLAVPGAGVRGLSPHAPYSVHPDLLRDVVDLAVEHQVPVAMHLAETLEEIELLESGSGSFVEFLKSLGVWHEQAIPVGSRPRDYLKQLARAPRGLVIHGNYLDRSEMDFLAEHPHLAVVYCPRTHAYFRHAPHPWREMRKRGVPVVIGTDSRASNPDLSVFRELQFLRSLSPRHDPAEFLRMGTLDGAAALGLAAETGSLAVGKLADLAVVALPASGSTDPWDLLLGPDSRVL